MGLSAFNRARHQRQALVDARARDDAEQNKDMRARYTPEEMAKFAENNDLLGSPPYADVDQLINIPADADLNREREAHEQMLRNRERVPTEEERWELQNSHFRDEKTKAIPDANESGKDRTLEGQKQDRRKASRPYEDPRVKDIHDGRLRANEPEEDRPDADTTVSDKTREDPVPPAEDDDPKTVEKIVADSEKKAARREKAEKQTQDAAAKETAALLSEKGKTPI